MTRSRSEPLDLHELVRRLQRLRPCWQRPEAFFEERAELAHALRRIARHGSPLPASQPAGPSPRELRAVALARALAGEVERLRRQLAQAARPRPRRRRREVDRRQLALPV
jgi:hypothetical protein